jgi:hypothetical protein
MRFVGCIVAIAVLAGGTARTARADTQVEKADRLFAEGRALMASNLIQACDKFEESLRLNSAAIGTLLNVALCDEKLGRVASAALKFTEARDRAKEQGLREHLRAAEEHLATLEPIVPHIAIQLTEQLPDTSILVDGRTAPLDNLAAIPIDPGERVVVVSAVGRLPYRVQFMIGQSEHKTLVIPALARSITVTSSRRRIGQIATITGGVAFGTSVGLALYGLHLHNQQFENKNCMNVNGVDLCNEIGQPINDRARTYGNVATYVGGLGLVAIAAGAYLWYTAPTGTQVADKTLAIMPVATSDTVGLTAVGRF